MLARAQARLARRSARTRPALVRGDITALPFGNAAFGLVIAPYGMLQSLLSAVDLDRTLREIARVLRHGGLVGIDLVPDLPSWSEYRRRVQLRGRAPGGGRMALVETVRQDRRRRLTIFDEEFVVRRGTQEDRRSFSLRFRTVEVGHMVTRLSRVGLSAEAVLGDYRGGPIRSTSDAWLVLARKK
jgi:SAM-dependent methyltransferase